MLPDGIELDGKDNLIFMVTKSGKQHMRVRESRLIHDGGHLAYNRYVGDALRAISETATSTAVATIAVRALQTELRDRLRSDDPTLPWR